MKRLLQTAFVLAFILCSSVSAEFLKVNTYKSGMFCDVNGGSWYEEDVALAYELGFMTGTSDAAMSPQGEVTVAQALTIASRMNASFYGRENELSGKGEKWYSAYISYSEKYGISEKDAYDSLERPAFRHEIAVIFANAFDEGYYKAENDIKSIPDVNGKDAFYDEVMLLYKAGVVMGSDENGTFYPYNTIKRNELSAIIARAAFPEKRLVKKASDAASQAVYLIDDTLFSKERYDGHGYELMHGWMIDDRGAERVNKYADFNEFFSDSKTDSYVAMHRYITPLTQEFAVLETEVFLKNAQSGFEIYFSDDGEEVIKVFTENGFFGLSGKEKIVGAVKTGDGTAKIRLEMNLKEKMAALYVNSSFIGEVELSDFSQLDKVTFGTTNEAKLMFSPKRIVLYMNFNVNDTFMLSETGAVPNGYNVSGDVKTAFNNSGSADSVSVLMKENSVAEREYEALRGGFVSEVYLLQQNFDGKAEITLDNAVTVEMNGGEYRIDGKKIATYNENVWQSIRFQRDDADNVTVRICGKDVYTFEYMGAVSSLRLENNKGTLWFDDVKCYNTYDFEDYVPKPVPNNKNNDLTVCMSVCSLWHEGSHYGWDYVSPYDELIPVMGFYDEGLPETADWEIKYLSESGIDAIQPCWYASTTDTPMKEPKLNKYAIHDGYFNAKYKENLGFCIMWENQSFKTNLTLENFKTVLWNYWVDWYFKDPGYMRLDNKAVLTIYQYETFMNCFTSSDEAKKVIDFMREDIRRYGYDDIILLFNIYTAEQANSIDVSCKEDGVEIDGLLPYHWGINAYDPEYIKSQHRNGYTDKGDNMIVACASTGRNIIGWEQTRSPIATYEQHLETLEYLTEELMPIYENDFGKDSWQSKLLFLGTWNEYAEGHWLAPTGENGKGPGFDYMNAWIETFVGENVSVAEPTEEQKKRISYMYPAVTTPIRAELIDTEKEDKDKTRVVSFFDFTAPDAMSKVSYSRLDSLGIENGVMYGKAESESTKKDPLVYFSTFKGVDTADVDIIHVRMKADVTTTVNVYGSFDYDDSITANKMMTLRYTTPNQWQDLYFETKDYGFWQGTIDKLRFDIINTYGNFECDTIELLQKVEEVGFGIVVDGARLSIHSRYIENRNDEVYLAALPSEGFYSASNIYYEWHRFDGKLYLKSGTLDDETDFVFTVGSDICLVNGKEENLKEKVTLFDGIPVIPVKFILDNAGIEYILKDNALEIDIRSVDYTEEADAGNYNFDVSGDYMGFGISKASGFVFDGALHVVPEKQKNGGYDPIVMNSSLNPVVFAEMCDSISIRMKYTLLGKSDDTASLHFTTSKDTAFDEKKSVKLKLSSAEKDSQGYAVYNFNMADNSEWTGTVTGIRFDPANSDGEFVIDYIKINKKE